MLIDRKREALQKELQQKLIEADRLIDECCGLAERAATWFSFAVGPVSNTYVPESLVADMAEDDTDGEDGTEEEPRYPGCSHYDDDFCPQEEPGLPFGEDNGSCAGWQSSSC